MCSSNNKGVPSWTGVIKDNLPALFSGRVLIAGDDNVLDGQFTLSDSLVTIMPLTKEASKELRKCSYNFGEEASYHRWFYGYSDSNSAIAFLQLSPMKQRMSSGVDMEAGYFHTPIIVHGSNSLINDVSSFDAMEFYGGVMEQLYNPGYAVKIEDRSIIYNDPSDYVHEYKANINGETIKVILFLRANVVYSYDVPDLKNNVSSALRFEFESRKPLDDIQKYYNYAMKLFQFCSGRLNVYASICLFNSKVSSEPIYVRYRDGYHDYANLQPLQVIRLLSLGDNLPELLSVLNDNDKTPYFEFLPAANKYVNSISYIQTIDLCVAFENEYTKLMKYLEDKCDNDNYKNGRDSDALINQAKEFSDKLIEFINGSDVDDRIKEKATGMIGANLTNYSPSQKEKMFFIYDRYQDEIRKITEQRYDTRWGNENDPVTQCLKALDHEALGMTKIYSDEEFRKKIKDFIKVRGSTAHAGIKWNGGEEIYMHLVLLIYFSVLERAGYAEDDRGRILSWLFYYRF